MDISANKYESDEKHPRPGLFTVVSQIVRWLAGFFRVTNEDLFKAGIYLGGEGHD